MPRLSIEVCNVENQGEYARNSGGDSSRDDSDLVLRARCTCSENLVHIAVEQSVILFASATHLQCSLDIDGLILTYPQKDSALHRQDL